MRAGDGDVTVAGVHGESHPSWNADRDVERRRTKIAAPVPATIRPIAVVRALIAIIEKRADRDAFAGAAQLEADVSHATVAQDLFGAELDLGSCPFGDGDVADRAVEAEPLTAGDGFVSGEHLGVATKNLGAGKGWNQRDEGQDAAEYSHWYDSVWVTPGSTVGWGGRFGRNKRNLCRGLDALNAGCKMRSGSDPNLRQLLQ